MRPRQRNINRTHNFNKQLAMEARWLPKMHQLFYAHYLADVTKINQFQKKGTDFLLYPSKNLKSEYWLLEFKFDTYNTGNLTLEMISVDRKGSLKITTPGWMVTSSASWLCYAFITTGDMLTLRMAALRKWLVANYRRFKTTSVRNETYFSWCVVIPIHVLCRELPEEAWFWTNLREALPHCTFEKPLMANAAMRAKAFNADALVGAIELTENESIPLAVNESFTDPLCQHLWDKNLKKEPHTDPEEPIVIHRPTAFSTMPCLLVA